MKKHPKRKNPKHRALRLLSVRNLTCEELTERLLRDGFTSQEIEAVIQWLKELGYLDDKRTAEFWVDYRNRFRPTGIYGLKHELRQKGVALDIIEDVVNSSELDYELALKLAADRLKTLNRLPVKKQYQRIGGLLNRRGFSWDVIRRVLDVLFDSSLDSDL